MLSLNPWPIKTPIDSPDQGIERHAGLGQRKCLGARRLELAVFAPAQ
jgi:hypothetical protein